MKQLIHKNLFTGVLALAAMSISITAHAELHSKSNEIVVMEPQDLPASARVSGEALFLHSDNSGRTFLYMEQELGARLSVFDVTDPASIKLASTVNLEAASPFDVARSLGEEAELIRFRSGNAMAVLDLRKPTRPTLHRTSLLDGQLQSESLGTSALLTRDGTASVPELAPQDIRVVDTSNPSRPVLLTTIKQVEHRVSRGDTGTVFLLGIDGLSVIRRVDVETSYKTHQMQMQGN